MNPGNPPAPSIEELTLPLAGIRRSHPGLRREIDPAELQQLAQSLQSVGQLQSIGVYPGPAGAYELLFGQRRLGAATLLGWETIRASVFPLHQPQHSLILTIQAAENLQSERLKTVEIIEVIRRLKDSGLDKRALSQVLCQSLAWVRDHEFVLQNPLARSIAESARLLDAASLCAFMEFPPSIRKLLMETV